MATPVTPPATSNGSGRPLPTPNGSSTRTRTASRSAVGSPPCACARLAASSSHQRMRNPPQFRHPVDRRRQAHHLNQPLTDQSLQDPRINLIRLATPYPAKPPHHQRQTPT